MTPIIHSVYYYLKVAEAKIQIKIQIIFFGKEILQSISNQKHFWNNYSRQFPQKITRYALN